MSIPDLHTHLEIVADLIDGIQAAANGNPNMASIHAQAAAARNPVAAACLLIGITGYLVTITGIDPERLLTEMRRHTPTGLHP